MASHNRRARTAGHSKPLTATHPDLSLEQDLPPLTPTGRIAVKPAAPADSHYTIARDGDLSSPNALRHTPGNAKRDRG